MRHKGLNLIVIILFGLGLTELQAQSMYVQEVDGTQTAYSLSNITKISFSSANLIITQIDNSSEDYTLGSVQYLSFSDSTSVSNGPENIESHDIRMYPNPVYRDLKIDLSSAVLPHGTLHILSVEGRLLKTLQIKGSGIISVEMSHLPKGIYICLFSNEAETKSFKIIKQ